MSAARLSEAATITLANDLSMGRTDPDTETLIQEDWQVWARTAARELRAAMNGRLEYSLFAYDRSMLSTTELALVTILDEWEAEP